MEKLLNKNIVIVTHVYAEGAAQALKEYLIAKRIPRLLFIGHPLFYNPILKGSGYELYENSECKRIKYGKIRKLPEVFCYFVHLIYTVFWAWRFGKNWDLFVGSDNLNALAGLILKKMGVVNKVIYYVIDYSPVRFKNRLLNSIYHHIDRFCVRNCDVTWNLSARIEKARADYFNFRSPKQKEVPIGLWFERIPRKSLEEINKNTLVFMGHILKSQGIQYVLRAVPEIAKEIPAFRFLVIGGGDYLDELKKISREMDIEKYVTFTGYVNEHKDIEAMLASCAAAVVLYEQPGREEPGFASFSDSGKIKYYLGCGLPVILSDVPHNARELESRGCAVVVSYQFSEIARAVTSLMKDKERLRAYRQSAVSYAKEFDWNKIFEKNLCGML